jgi:hypothetical protein
VFVLTAASLRLGQSIVYSIVQTSDRIHRAFAQLEFPCSGTVADQQMSVLDSTPIGDSNCVGPGTGGGGPG